MFRSLFVTTLVVLSLATGSPSASTGDVSQQGAGTMEQSPNEGAPASVTADACESATNGGSAVLNDCSSQGEVTIKANGDVFCESYVTAGVEAGSSDDKVRVGSESIVGVQGSGCTINAQKAWGTSLYAANSASATGDMRINVPGGGYVLVSPGSAVFYKFPVQPGV